ncbi:aminotransferase class V-fold PLP-dependent enzyme [Psychromonas sp.]|uniref:aminotransferase class V-fold PLP-dependent enzyme n=1 Tax=Psychromonas sp. TaxID=1884585 RepID=UPI0035696281
MSENNDNHLSSLSRRNFLKTTTGLALAGTALISGTAQAAGKYHSNHGDFWENVSDKFTLDPATTYMNIGTTGSMPRQVLDNYNENNRIVASNPWDMQNKFGSWPHTTEMTDAIAPGFGANADEIVISRNTTDGMVSILNGLDFQPGDVILTTHHEHVAANSPLYIAAKRNGVEVVELEIPVYTGHNKITEDDFVKVFKKAVKKYKNSVRLITFSHITYKTGTTLPAKRICQEVAIPNRIPTLIDGAHTIGMLNLDFHDIGCDFYAGSGHKWQCGPGSTGILYVRTPSRFDDSEENYWPDRDMPLWFVNSSLGHLEYFSAQWKLQYKGNDNFPALQALTDSCLIWDEIGRDKIEERVLTLSALCKDELSKAFPRAYSYAPNIPELSSGITTINPFDDQTDLTILNEFRDRLREEYGYIIRTTDFKVAKDDALDSHALRISTHLFHSKEDVIGLVEAMQAIYLSM